MDKLRLIAELVYSIRNDDNAEMSSKALAFQIVNILEGRRAKWKDRIFE